MSRGLIERANDFIFGDTNPPARVRRAPPQNQQMSELVQGAVEVMASIIAMKQRIAVLEAENAGLRARIGSRQ